MCERWNVNLYHTPSQRHYMVSEVVLLLAIMAGLSLKPPGPLSFDGNVAENWKVWYRSWNIFACASELGEKTEPVQCATFLHVAGNQAQHVHSSWTFADGEIDRIGPLISRFAGFCEPQKNVTVSRYIFNTRAQLCAEPFASYITSLRELVQSCEYGALEDELLRDRLVCGLADDKQRERLLRTPTLTLRQAIELCSSAEASADQLRVLRPEGSAEVHYVRRGNGKPKSRKSRDGDTGDKREKVPCNYCLFSHVKGRCPAYKQKCHGCGKTGHFRKSPKCEKNRKDHQKRRHVNEVEDSDCDSTSSSDEDVYTDSVQIDSAMDALFVDLVHSSPEFDHIDSPPIHRVDSISDWTQYGLVSNVNVKFKLDTGSQVNILPESIFECVKHCELTNKRVNLKSYSGHNIENIGEAKIDVTFAGKVYAIQFQIVKGSCRPILGKSTCEVLGLISRNYVFDKQSSRSGSGCITRGEIAGMSVTGTHSHTHDVSVCKSAARQCDDDVRANVSSRVKVRADESSGKPSVVSSDVKAGSSVDDDVVKAGVPSGSSVDGDVLKAGVSSDVKAGVSSSGIPDGMSEMVDCDTIKRSTMSQLSARAEKLLKDNDDLFNGLGRLVHHEYDISMRDNHEGVQRPARTIPYKQRDSVKAELDRMVKLDVIVPEHEPTEWVNTMSVAHKSNGEIRLCLDPKDLNKAIRREHYPMTTLEGIAARIPKANFFSKCDAKSGYWQLKLSTKSSKLTTFNTPFGRYRYKVLPFGISSASEIWQRAMMLEFGDLEGVEIIVDDFLIWGETQEQHDEHLAKFLERVRQSGLRLNRDKSVFSVRSVEFSGHIISDQGLQASPERIRAIIDMPYPSDRKELETFLGMVTYLSKFLPNMSEATAPVRELLKSDVVWQWESRHSAAIDKLKGMMMSAPILALYDVNKPCVLMTDASKNGFGAVLLQNDQPIAYASRRVNSAEQNYATIEKEMCAILFACHKFHDYIFGQKTKVITDHKPLVGIFEKLLTKLSPRLQRMRMHLFRYDLEISWKPGKEVPVPDALSRFLPKSKHSASEFDDALEVNLVIQQLPISEKRLHEFRVETASDTELCLLRDMIIRGWPADRNVVPSELLPYFTIRDSLVYCDGLLFKDERVVVPKTLRRAMIGKIHESHQGVVKSKQRARAVLFWPNMNAEIEEAVSLCSICQEYRKSQAHESMIPHPIPDRPWAKVGVDVFHIKHENFLLLVDYYSKFPEVQPLSDLTSKSAIKVMKSVFSRNGTPDIVISDNASQFCCQEFRNFMDEWEFDHMTISPGYSQSNGQVERCVQTVKTLIKKSYKSGHDYFNALLEYRNTPLDGTDGYSPAQLLNSRLLKSKVPTTTALLKPHVVPNMKQKLVDRQLKQKHYHDKKAKDLLSLCQGQSVRFLGPKGDWRIGKIIGEHSTPRSYLLEAENGHLFRRNRRHIFDIPNMSVEPQREDGNGIARRLLEQERLMRREVSNEIRDPEPGVNQNSHLSSSENSTDQTVNQSGTVNQAGPVSYKTRSGRASKKPEKLDL